MRKHNWFLGLLLLSLPGMSQFKKGDKMVGVTVGSVFFNSGNSDFSYTSAVGYSSKSTGFGLQLQPSYGWFVSEKTAFGVALNLQPSSNNVTYESNGTTFKKDKTSNFNFGLGGFARNYFSTGAKLMPYGQFGLNIGLNSQTTSGFNYVGSGASAYKDTYDGKSSGGFFTNASLQLGFTKMLGQYTGLDFFAGYGYSYSKTESKTTTKRDLGNNGSIDETFVNEPTIKSTNHNLMLGVVFQVFLEGKKK